MTLNKVILQGRFVADPELKHTANGVDVVSFRLAVDRNFKARSIRSSAIIWWSRVAWTRMS